MPLPDLVAKREAIDKRQGYRRLRADKRHLRAEWMRKQKGRVYVGQESVTLADARVKYVSGHSPYFPFTAGELARIYLDDLLVQNQEQRICERIKLTDHDLALMDIQAPLYFNPEPSRRGRYAYIDINACYFQLWHRLPLNLAFDPESGKVAMPRPALRVPDCDVGWLGAAKALRNAMFGMFAKHEMAWYVNGKAHHHDYLGEHAAPGLVGYTKTRLRQIAREAVEGFGCRMWLTDAGIFEPRAGFEFQRWLLESWQLSSSVKAQGSGTLYALGDYWIGNIRSRGPHLEGPAFTNL